ncbi:FixJ family two-component response regulator [Paraburkholderia bannensis]|uniref:FixJ family two-component response regulator n=1 Tax=Paraburkholderia bannensis TaxID=765414 RepID=A0A7W9U155_9BURK|nr:MULTISPECIES: LuxR C-terminal-related transcriptional regulator [Paraburkholderia]MBB3259945.1 FixJ family two-component response regulator [Paraburkholderia sp. WP4_3_2]MBB6105151.1 FixJ family two-component response regulator [Paraburkholderia bannensis]
MNPLSSTDAPPLRDTPTVYIVDDDASVNEALCMLVHSVGLGARGFLNAQAFLDFARGDEPCCLVLDVRLRGNSGLSLQDTLNAVGDPIPVIVITGHGDVPMSVRVMKAGATDFLTKPFRDQDFLDAIAVSLERDRARRAAKRANQDVATRFESMSQREREVMALAASGRMNKQIADELGISEVTVKIHRGSAMRKMQARSFAELVILAHRLGIAQTQGSECARVRDMPLAGDKLRRLIEV